MNDLSKLLNKNVRVTFKNGNNTEDDVGVLTKFDDNHIEIKKEGFSAVDEFGTNMGETHLIHISLLIKIEERDED